LRVGLEAAEDNVNHAIFYPNYHNLKVTREVLLISLFGISISG
jgi:hypothetical protein